MESPLSKVEELRPCSQGYNLLLKVLSAKPVAVQPSRDRQRQQPQMRIAECIVGDDTGVVVFTARNDQGFFFPSSSLSFPPLVSVCDIICLVPFPYY
jgi:ssDNA-binding replication factor A large subunit